MTKERNIVLEHGIPKAKLVALRKSTLTVKKDVDWYTEPGATGGRGGKRGAVVWTKEGLIKLYALFQIEAKPVHIPDPVELKESEVSKPEVKTNVPVPGIVRRKFPNRRLVLCEIRGVNGMVVVRDSTNLRVGNIISVTLRGNQLIGT